MEVTRELARVLSFQHVGPRGHIRAFLASTFACWSTPPSHCLVVCLFLVVSFRDLTLGKINHYNILEFLKCVSCAKLSQMLYKYPVADLPQGNVFIPHLSVKKLRVGMMKLQSKKIQNQVSNPFWKLFSLAIFLILLASYPSSRFQGIVWSNFRTSLRVRGNKQRNPRGAKCESEPLG